MIAMVCVSFANETWWLTGLQSYFDGFLLCVASTIVFCCIKNENSWFLWFRSQLVTVLFFRTCNFQYYTEKQQFQGILRIIAGHPLLQWFSASRRPMPRQRNTNALLWMDVLRTNMRAFRGRLWNCPAAQFVRIYSVQRIESNRVECQWRKAHRCHSTR